jgi:hypothetical protein
MKKIFRGVALHQADIEPSTINIEANIKTKLPTMINQIKNNPATSLRPNHNLPRHHHRHKHNPNLRRKIICSANKNQSTISQGCFLSMRQ